MVQKLLSVLPMLLMAGMLAACSGPDEEPDLLEFPGRTSPDELGVLPAKPLELPESISQLPPPDPNAEDRAMPTPIEDVAVLLGGEERSISTDGRTPASDQQLIRYASRNGVIVDVRGVLAREDLEFRSGRTGRVLERLAKRNLYFEAYRGMSLDKIGELERARRAGINTPTDLPPLVTVQIQ